MSISQIGRRGQLAAVAAVAAFATSTSFAASLPVHHEGPVSFVSAGVGQDEVQAVRAQMPQWPLVMEFAQHQGNHNVYLADVAVEVRDAHGQDVLKTRTDGPYLLAKLPRGRYSITAQAGQQTQHHVVKVGTHPAHVVLVWPGSSSAS